MRFLRKNKIKRSILVISDIHLGAGAIIHNRRNFLEDFHYDSELVEFLKYFSSGDYSNREIDLIINGDLFDLLAVPFVPFFDDEFWSEKAALQKLKMITEAHPEVIEGLVNFISSKKRKIVFILGNHDAECVFPSLQKYLLSLFPEEDRERFTIISTSNGEYIPVEGVVLKHGHEYEIAHQYDPKDSVVVSEAGESYFIPPWGSYYVTRVINKFKEEKDHINSVRPIKKFLINGMIYDTLFTMRFLFANSWYFIMVRFIDIFKNNRNIIKVIKDALSELELFHDLESFPQDFFSSRPEVKALIVGHTHEPIFRSYADGNIFINTGTWTKMHHLDFGKRSNEDQLTYAHIDIKDVDKEQEKLGEKEELEISLNEWKGINPLPFCEYS